MTTQRTLQRWSEVLMKAGLVDELQIRSATAKVGKWGGRLPRVLAEMGAADEDQMTEVLAKSLGVQMVHLGGVQKDPNALKALGAPFCEEHLVFPVSLRDRKLTLAMADPTEMQVTDEAASRARARVYVVMASESQIRVAIARHFHNQELQLPPVRRPTLDPAPDEPSARETSPVTLSPEELHRLRAAYENQAKVSSILRAVTELLIEKGLMPRGR
jgi:hypothetical protein